MTYGDIKNEWLAPATDEAFRAFYLVNIKPLDSRYSAYKLDSLEDARAVERVIYRLATEQMGLTPPQLYFPATPMIKYANTLNMLGPIAGNWVLGVQVADTIQRNSQLINSDPAIKKMYDDRTYVVLSTFRMLSRDMIDIRMLDEYMEKYRANN